MQWVDFGQCPDCDGSGRLSDDSVCPTCEGSGKRFLDEKMVSLAVSASEWLEARTSKVFDMWAAISLIYDNHLTTFGVRNYSCNGKSVAVNVSYEGGCDFYDYPIEWLWKNDTELKEAMTSLAVVQARKKAEEENQKRSQEIMSMEARLENLIETQRTLITE